jgi:hypothetical protein
MACSPSVFCHIQSLRHFIRMSSRHIICFYENRENNVNAHLLSASHSVPLTVHVAIMTIFKTYVQTLFFGLVFVVFGYLFPHSRMIFNVDPTQSWARIK